MGPYLVTFDALSSHVIEIRLTFSACERLFFLTCASRSTNVDLLAETPVEKSKTVPHGTALYVLSCK